MMILIGIIFFFVSYAYFILYNVLITLEAHQSHLESLGKLIKRLEDRL